MRLTLLLYTLLLTSSLVSQVSYEQILREYYTADGPAAAAIVTSGDQILYRGAVGMADMELGVEAIPEHIFRLGSITKQFTAVSILMLQEEGKLNVQDPITDYIPGYPVGDNEITIEHLLTHTSGIQSYTDIPGFMQDRVYKDMTVDELIDVFKDEPMNFKPGDEWRYNNSGYILLGKIIEVVSGMTYEDFIEEKIFKPLKMNNSYYDNNGEIVPNRAHGYSAIGEGEYARARYLSMSLPYAAGSLMSTVDDLYTWNTAVMKGDVVDLGLLKHAFEDYKLNDGSPCGYGYGWSLSKIKGHKVIEHGGGIFGFVTQGIYMPETDVYVAILTNTDGRSPNGAATRMAALASGLSLEYKPMGVDPDELEQYVGVYAIEGSDQKRVVTVRDGQLYTQRAEGQIFPVTPYGEDKFFYEDSRTTLEFDRDDEGNIVGQTVTSVSGDDGYALKTGEEVPTKAATVDVAAAILETYTGTYELMPGMNIDVRIVNDKLQAQATGQGAFDLEAYSDNEFGFPPAGIKMIFPKDENGKVSHFVLLQGGQEITAKRKD